MSLFSISSCINSFLFNYIFQIVHRLMLPQPMNIEVFSDEVRMNEA